jgi:hypothetical protein
LGLAGGRALAGWGEKLVRRSFSGRFIFSSFIFLQTSVVCPALRGSYRVGLEGKSYFCSKFIRDALVRSLRITDGSGVLLGEEGHSDSHFFLIFLDDRLQE